MSSTVSFAALALSIPLASQQNKASRRSGVLRPGGDACSTLPSWRNRRQVPRGSRGRPVVLPEREDPHLVDLHRPSGRGHAEPGAEVGAPAHAPYEDELDDLLTPVGKARPERRKPRPQLGGELRGCRFPRERRGLDRIRKAVSDRRGDRRVALGAGYAGGGTAGAEGPPGRPPRADTGRWPFGLEALGTK